MAKRFYIAVMPALLGWLTSCAASRGEDARGVPPQQSGRMLYQVLPMIADLARLPTRDEMRSHLEEGLEANEVNYRGFDQVTVAECIDRVVAAAMDDRANPDSQMARARLVESLDVYFDAKREARIHRWAGAAPCQPFLR